MADAAPRNCVARAPRPEVKGFFHILGSMLAANDKLAHRALVMKLASEATANQESDKRLRLTMCARAAAAPPPPPLWLTRCMCRAVW